ncbi:MAG: AsmA family protein [Hyphomonadaceae bacterium]
MKLWKMIAIGAGAVVGLLILAVGLFFAFFPKELAAREAERRIEEATGRDLVLGDNIDISFWPVLGFSVDHASLSNPEGFSQDTPFIAADRIVFAVKVMPLLHGAVEVKELIFEGAQVNMLAQADGAANWTFPTAETSPEQQTTLEDLRLDDVRLTNGVISFQGADGASPLVIEEVNASLALASLDSPAQMQADLTYRGERMNVDGEIGLPRAMLEKGQTPLTARVRTGPLTANFEGAFDSASGALTGALEANGPSVRRLASWMGAPIGEGGGFGAYRLTAQMTHEGETTELRDASIRLDDIDARGRLSLNMPEGGRMRVSGALSAPNIDLNTYLPAPAQGANQGVEVNTAWPTTALDLSGLRALDADLDLTLGALRFQRMSFADVALNLRLRNGAADARLSRISLYEGAGTARLIADGSHATPRIAVELNAQNVQAETLLRDAIGFDKIAGRGRLTASLVGQGASLAAIMQSLNGNASFNFNDGQWKGVNLAQVARTVQAALSGQSVGGGAATDFAELSATFAVANGVMATDNLRLLNPFVRLEGRGLMNIGAQTIDMRIAPRAVNSAQGQGGDVNVGGLGIPFRVSGPWSHVSFRPALEDVAQSELRSILRNQNQGSVLGRIGDALFGQQPQAAQPLPDEAQASAGETPETPATAPAEQPPQQRIEDRARDALGGLLRNAIGGNHEKQDPPPDEAAPSP